MKLSPLSLLLCLQMIVPSALFAGEALNVQPVGNELRPFTTDRCSYSLDGNWSDCCFQHDYSYWQGGTEADRMKADETFYKCVAAVSSVVVATPYYYAVRWFGGGQSSSFRWGYGWKYPRGLRPLNQEERNLVNKTPFVLKEVQKMNPTQAPGVLPYPSATGNLCLDEVVTAVHKTERLQMRTLNYTVHSRNPLQYKVTFPELPGRVYLATTALSSEAPCYEQNWSDQPSQHITSLTTLR